MFFSKQHSPFLKFLYPVVLFIIVSVMYPKRKIFAYELSEPEQQKYLKGYMVYVVTSIFLLIVVAVWK